MFLERYILYTYSDVLNDSAPKSKKSILLHVPILMIVKLFLVNRHDKKLSIVIPQYLLSII